MVSPRYSTASRIWKKNVRLLTVSKRGPAVGLYSRAKLKDMEVTLHIPDDIAMRLSAGGGDVSRRALEAIALEGYRNQTLTLYQVSAMLGLSRVQTEDFLGQHHVPLAAIDEADLDREAALFEAASPRKPR
jgi:predicted HTH domain antitoxin